MKIILGIWVGLVYIHCGVVAQSEYEKHPYPQQIKYDDDHDDGPTYSQHQSKYSLAKESLSNSYDKHHRTHNEPSYAANSPYPQPEHYQQSHAYRYIPRTEEPKYHQHEKQQPEQTGYYHLSDHLLPHSQGIHQKQSESNKVEPEYHVPRTQEHKSRVSPYEQPEELQYSQEPDQPVYHQPAAHASPIYHQPAAHASPTYHQGAAPQTPHSSPAYHQPVAPQSPHLPVAYHPPATPEYAHDSSKYHQPSVPQHPQAPPTYHQPSSVESSPAYHQPSAVESSPASPAYHRPSSPGSSPASSEYHQPSAPKTPHSQVVRDPKLPLFFTMYEKRIIQDPVNNYGKGPWRYLTYGHGITYGSKEPGKVFERGYGYIRALGRDHCKLPENKCPKSDDKPFEYEGRKEPYFGYRPH